MISTIFRKELKDTLRDRRTLIMMLVIPMLIFPIILNVFVGVSKSFQDEAANKKVTIGMIGSENNTIETKLRALPSVLGEKTIRVFQDTSELKKAIQSDSIDFGIVVPNTLQSDLEAKKTATIYIIYNGTELGTKERANAYLDMIDNQLKKERYVALNINEETITPIALEFSNTASAQEMIGKLAGGVLPYIFIAFGFIGCMYPAIDLFTGEKERGTIETLLTTPIPRWQILFGKMGVVVLSGLLAATCALLGLFLSIEVFQIVEDPALLDVIHSVLSLEFILMLFGLLIPLTIFFAGVMIPIAVYAKTFKEAQSIITPLNIVMVLPAMVGFFPGIELNAITALIPVVNIVLATKELMAGTLDYSLLALAFSVMTLLAFLAVVFSYKRFDKETNVVIS